MSRLASPLRFVALLLAGALAIHELRYRIGYHELAATALREQGHAYLTVVGLLVSVVVAVALALFGAALLRARGGASHRSGRSPLALSWAYATFSLIALYTTQELLEGLLSAGHRGGLAGVVGNGGWAALCLALVLGAGIALLCRGAEVAIALVAGRARRPRRRPRAAGRPRPPRSLPRPLDAVARNLAGRGPPLLSRV
ncbi:MAG: hypothetical protein ACR2GL_07745 [Thermoleophilaceae bacterium]